MRCRWHSSRLALKRSHLASGSRNAVGAHRRDYRRMNGSLPVRKLDVARRHSPIVGYDCQPTRKRRGRPQHQPRPRRTVAVDTGASTPPSCTCRELAGLTAPPREASRLGLRHEVAFETGRRSHCRLDWERGRSHQSGRSPTRDAGTPLADARPPCRLYRSCSRRRHLRRVSDCPTARPALRGVPYFRA